MTLCDKATRVLEAWFTSLRTYKSVAGLPARGTVAAGLVVLEHLRTEYQLDLRAHLAKGGAQIRGLNPRAVKEILARYGETRPFSVEAGRTNRGAPGGIEDMLQAIQELGLEREAKDARNKVLDAMQSYLVDKVKEYHGRKRLEIGYDPNRTTWSVVHDLLGQAEQVCKGGPVAQYLVGAKLELRFPRISIPNDHHSAADVQSGRLGDFEMGGTVFHVTVSPMPGLYDKCKRNIADGARVYILVPDALVVGARQNADAVAPARIAVESVESFVANNIEELSQFSKNQLKGGFRRLLETYNRRVELIEPDKSLLILIPPSLD